MREMLRRNRVASLIEIVLMLSTITLTFLYEFSYTLNLARIAVYFIFIWFLVGICIFLFVKYQFVYRIFSFLMHQFLIITIELVNSTSPFPTLLFFLSGAIVIGLHDNKTRISFSSVNYFHFLLYRLYFNRYTDWKVFLIENIMMIILNVLIPFIMQKNRETFLALSYKNRDLEKERRKGMLTIQNVLSKIQTPSFIIDENGIIILSNHKFELFNREIGIDGAVEGQKWYASLPQSYQEQGRSYDLFIKDGSKAHFTFQFLSSENQRFWFYFERVVKTGRYICRLYSSTRGKGFQIQNTNNALMDYIRTHDEPSGLLNKGGFIAVLDSMMISNADDDSLIVMLLRIDNMERIINERGGNIYNEFIRRKSIQLESFIKKNDFAARIRDDSFAVLINASSQFGEMIVSRILGRFAEENGLGSSERLLFKIHSCYLKPERGIGGAETLRQLESMINYCVRMDIAHPLFYSDEIKRALNTDFHCRRIIQEEALSLFAMPIYYDGRIKGFEILTRLKDCIFLDDFFASAQRQGLNDELDSLIFRKSEELLGYLLLKECLPEEISINLLPSTLENDFLIDQIIDLMRPWLRRTSIILEIIEDTFRTKQPPISIEKLKRAGFKIAVDDFGTGFSSLERISKVDVDLVKIDKSLVDDIATDEKQVTFLNSLISFLFENDLTITIEGIESRQQYEKIAHREKIKFQGYYFSKALAPDEIPGIMENKVYSAY